MHRRVHGHLGHANSHIRQPSSIDDVIERRSVLRSLGDLSVVDVARFRVPLVVAVGPGKRGGEGREEVVKGPREDDVVLAVEEEHDDGARPADTCSSRRGFVLFLF